MATEKQKTAARRNLKKARAAQGSGARRAKGSGRRTASTSTAEQNRLSDDDFAFPKERKEPLTDAPHVRNTIARFDQVEDVSDADRTRLAANQVGGQEIQRRSLGKELASAVRGRQGEEALGADRVHVPNLSRGGRTTSAHHRANVALATDPPRMSERPCVSKVSVSVAVVPGGATRLNGERA